jgi:hypothetical protein
MNLANLINALLFQSAWFACVIGGAAGTSIWGGGTLAALTVFALLRDRWRSDLSWAAAAAATGFVLDTLWIRLGVLDYGATPYAPLWIVMLWAAVGLTLNHSLGFFARRPWLGAVLAGATAPVSYLAGARLGGVVVPEPVLLAGISVVWAGVFYMAFACSGRRGAAIVAAAR